MNKKYDAMKISNKTACRVCGNVNNKFLFNGPILGDINVDYFDCPICHYVQTENPYWLDRAYIDTINTSDTGIMLRNSINARIVLASLILLKQLNGLTVDYAGGYGILVRILRDYGVQTLWADRFCTNLFARGFEYTAGTANLVTCFEALEHFVNPLEELENMFEIAPNVLFSTELIPNDAPKHKDWWYYGHEHGQHVGFFRLKTLEKIAKERGKFLVSDGHSYHLMADKSITPLYWRLIIRLNRLLPLALRNRLISKTWSDHLIFSGINK